jgi:hypothetical protein
MNSRLLACAILLVVQSAAALAGGPRHDLLSAILGDHVRGGLVDYAGLAGDRRLEAYLTMLANTEPAGITDEAERLAFWINAYNAFTLELVIEHLPLHSIREIAHDGTGPWDIPFIVIAGTRYTLNQIEHEIIRREFSEPRIHMVLVCAARGCPPLRAEAYGGAALEEQMDDNTRRFMADPAKNRYEAETGTLLLSEIFSWFGEDFVRAYGSVQTFVRPYYRLEEGREFTIRYLPYDWSLNTVAADSGGLSR